MLLFSSYLPDLGNRSRGPDMRSVIFQVRKLIHPSTPTGGRPSEVAPTQSEPGASPNTCSWINPSHKVGEGYERERGGWGVGGKWLCWSPIQTRRKLRQPTLRNKQKNYRSKESSISVPSDSEGPWNLSNAHYLTLAVLPKLNPPPPPPVELRRSQIYATIWIPTQFLEHFQEYRRRDEQERRNKKHGPSENQNTADMRAPTQSSTENHPVSIRDSEERRENDRGINLTSTIVPPMEM